MADISGIVDALPYVDAGYDTPGVREAVTALVEEEMKRYRPTKDYLQNVVSNKFEVFQTDLMKAEFQRMAENKPMEKLDFKKYQQQPKPAINRRRDPTAWEECFDRVVVLHNHMVNRLTNLQLQAEYGAEIWRRYIPTVERQLKQIESELRDTRNRIQEINWERKNKQLQAGEKLSYLETSWVNLVAKNYEIEKVCLELEERISEWERFHEAKRLQKAQEKPNAQESVRPKSLPAPVDDSVATTDAEEIGPMPAT
ncbi:pre-mRNA-splicing factor SPF27-like [Paramacrobiotus metropolitanus]|uniref:pre-mRNA-splicing factor SPF27-like n=1 Tax=Paramacrobiotus metropolitanus TaxID=2943436 RepID=UPI0024462433|nr:pre-mRNA-splicing factor SPF27-like [Paramacrobiotus metropolitanus]